MSTASLFNQSLCTWTLADASNLLSEALSNPDLSGTFNPDVLGYGVRLSMVDTDPDFVINFCAAVIICWGSQEDIAEALRSTLLQIGAIVLCTLISLGRGQLFFLDGYFTLLVVHSPIAWYIVWINLRQIYLWCKGRKNMANPEEEEKLKADKHIPFNPLLCFTLVGAWLALNLVVWFKGRNFPGDECAPLSFKQYASTAVLVQMIPRPRVPFGINTCYAIAIPAFGSCILHYRKQAALIAQSTPSEWKKISTCVPFILQHHKWPIYLVVLFSYVGWVLQLSLFKVEPGFVFTYGQSLSVVAAVTGSIPVIKLLWKARKLTKTDLASTYRALMSDILFCFFGAGTWASRINRGFGSHLTLPPYDEDWIKLWSPSLPITNLPSPQPPIVSRPPTQTESAILRTNTDSVQGEGPGDGAAQVQSNTHTPNPPHSEDPITQPVSLQPQLATLTSDVAQAPDTSVPAHGAVEPLNGSFSGAEDDATPSAPTLPTTSKSDPDPPGEGARALSFHEEHDMGPIKPSDMSAEIQAKSSGRAEDTRRPRHRTTY
ncbi:hypothetical protein B0H16DRAFT_1853707 [Mycena metata]|uniref:Uncharacterized protein n=1 Tax=Mycena metata TaxID=1033252 RepID=A0AAD7NVX2_9AGAR|nr:hypothetical protein B0H16DRAFT_1853707 [Mycena metata]